MKTRYIATMGVFSALAIGLSAIENTFTYALPLGVHIGLANIVIMLALILFDGKSALILTILKSVFILATRGFTAFGTSMCGGILSLLVIYFLYKKAKPSILLLSICGAVSHNIGQLLFVTLVTKSTDTLLYIFVLMAGGFGAGIVTGIVLKLILPFADRIKRYCK